ncbi:cadherin-related family member 5-like isoform X2 [Betta splendens]|uniref:Cadherin-related family member 5-like isoform X2 n=1 Tax=Betta splendens TaxID=158456 RepID=A0A6P7MQ25_BETSP|nr:cadherin-related family member 5-like isoform X2 [Betta splendens]
MDVDRSRLAASALLSCLLVLLLQSPTEAQILCSARTDVYVAENLTAGVVVETIAVEAGVTLALKPTAAQAPFELVQNQLRTTEVLDFEVTPRYIINIVCSQEETSATLDLVIIVLVTNVNDNPPVFSQGLYRADVSEMSPVDAPVGSFPATDRDNLGPLYYTLTSGADQFKLRSTTNPEVLVNKLLEYDKVKSVQLVLEVQDTPLAPPVEPSFSSTATIVVTVTDRDDRPPWFQPCSRQEVGGAVVCLGPGYTGRVDHNEQAPGVLQLKPGPLYAVDGDSGINEGVTYRFLSGNDDGVFAISPSTGNISMLKPSGALGTVTLTVMAAQTVNTHQFSTTSVAISVQVKSLHPPQFQQPVYEAVVTGVGAMALDPNKEDEPLRIVATDGDYGSGGVNPHLSISIKGTSDFALIDGFLFMMKDLPDATFTLQVVALDASTDESDTADLTVTVATGLTTTTLPPSTDLTNMTTVGESTASSSAGPPTEGGVTGPGSSSAPPPAEIAPSGRFGAADMAALGATLGALLFLCALVIGALVRRTRNDKAAWRKIHEASAFRSSLGKGPGADNEGIQYSNEAFEGDGDGGSSSSSSSEGGESGDEWRQTPAQLPLKEAAARSAAPPRHLLPDDGSQADSDAADSEKGVKPILTKERRLEDGYKAVWFKEDIDPNTREVVVIPDREDERDEEQRADLDSGIGVRMDEAAQDFTGSSDDL